MTYALYDNGGLRIGGHIDAGSARGLLQSAFLLCASETRGGYCRSRRHCAEALAYARAERAIRSCGGRAGAFADKGAVFAEALL